MTTTEVRRGQDETPREPMTSEEITRMYADAYRRIPVTREEMAWAEWAAREAVAEEPW